MKKLFTITLVAVVALVLGSAKANTTFAKDDLVGSVTVGFGHGFGQKIAIDYGIVDGWIDNKASLGIGASLNNTIGWHGGDNLTLIANCSFHYEFVENLDTYAVVGFGGGVHMWGHGAEGLFDWTSSVGARYYLTPAFALNAEIGHTNSCYANLGVSFKF